MGTWGILLAAGRGSRFGGHKQFVEVSGRRLVDRVVDVMTSVCSGVVLVLPAGTTWDGPAVAAVVAGGATRSASVRAGLAAIPDTAAIVVVHDAAHPLAPRRLFAAVIDAARAGADAAVPGLPLDEPVKRVGEDGEVIETLDRTDAFLIQTPHAFRASVLRGVHVDEPEGAEDSELVERRGGGVVLVAGDPRNVHVTTPAHVDLVARLAGAGWEDIDT